MPALSLSGERVLLRDIKSFVFGKSSKDIALNSLVIDRIRDSHNQLIKKLEDKKPIYGITTGLGDSCQRYVDPSQSSSLQLNLVRYLGCGGGKNLSLEASRATFLIHFITLCKGYSAVSPKLIEHMKLFLERDWIPVIPREGSLGASGDLVPLSYIARALVGEAEVYVSETKTVHSAELLQQAGIAPLKLKPKEGLSLVNGVAAMAGQMLINLQDAEFLSQMALLSTSWLCLALGGKSEAFSPLIHEQAKNQKGQALAAQKIRELLQSEDYSTNSNAIGVMGGTTDGFVQDRYSLRCTPQIMGPILDTIELGWMWNENEINACSDNPVISPTGDVAMGGNFYGGYLSLGTDYLKISLANVADLLDRQLMLIIDDKSNRGLPPNLAAWENIPAGERHLHHGLKGLHQATSAITAEIMAKAIPNSIFSRSSESHNQDKVSMGMGAANQCSDMIEQLYRVQTMHLVCLAQALDLRKIKLKGEYSRLVYDKLRDIVPFVSKDKALGGELLRWENELHKMSRAGF